MCDAFEGQAGGVSLRPFAPEDADAVLSWFATAEELTLFAGVTARWPMTAEQLNDIEAGPGVRPFTVVLGGSSGRRTARSTVPSLIGHVALVDMENGLTRLARIALAPSVRGRGLASGLVAAALAEAARLGARRVGLLVMQENSRALHTYLRAGFVIAPTHPEFPAYTWMTRDI